MLPLPFLVPHSPCIPEGPGLTWVVRDSPGRRRLWSYGQVRRGASHAKIWQKRVPGRRNSKGKGHEGDRRLELLRKVRRCGWRVISSRSREAAGAGPSGRGLGSVPRN